MLVDIDYVLAVQARLRKINAENMEDIVWIKDGKVVEFRPEALEKFRFTGMHNTDVLWFCDYEEVD